jgi:hypothetical protein
MIGYWQKINIDNYLKILPDYYKDCSKPYVNGQNSLDNLNQEEIEYLNSNLQLDKIVGVDKNLIVNYLLQNSEKHNFLLHLFSMTHIKLELNSLDETKKSVFQLLVENLSNEEYTLRWNLPTIYKRGFTNIKSDEKFLADYFKTSIKHQNQYENWCIARVCYKLNDYEKIEIAIRNEKLIFILLSFKLKKPIGFHFPNLLGIASNAMQHYRESGDLIIKAMHKYEVWTEITSRDKKGNFKSKMADYQIYKPIQNEELNKILFEIFPELND